MAPPPPSLSRHSLVVSPMLASHRTSPSATVSQAPPSPPRFCYAGGARSSTVHAALRLVVARSSSHVTAALSVNDASSSLRVAVPGSWHYGPSTCSSSCVAVDSSATCFRYR